MSMSDKDLAKAALTRAKEIKQQRKSIVFSCLTACFCFVACLAVGFLFSTAEGNNLIGITEASAVASIFVAGEPMSIAVTICSVMLIVAIATIVIVRLNRKRK